MGILESLRAQSRLKIQVLGLALSALAQAQEPLLAIGKWLPQGVANVRVSSDGRYLLVMPHYYEDPDRNLELWRVSDGQRIAELHQKAQHLSAGYLRQSWLRLGSARKSCGQACRRGWRPGRANPAALSRQPGDHQLGKQRGW